jgi:general secretion pathway protein K
VTGVRSVRGGSRGAAIISALLVVALVAITAGAMLAQQSQALTRTEASVGRAQVRAYAGTALQWTRGILFDDATRGTSDHLGEPWARGMAALPVDSAVISGMIQDEQGRFNLNNLVGTDGKVSIKDAEAFRRLLTRLSLQPDLADAVVDWIDKDGETTSPSGAEDPAYLALPVPYRAANRLMVSADELARVRGFDEKTLKRIRPHVTALPVRTPLNLNTAQEDVIAAVLNEVPEVERGRILAERVAKPFATREDITARVPKAPADAGEVNVNSNFFLARVAIVSSEPGGAQLRAQALLQRKPNVWPVIIWQSPL